MSLNIFCSLSPHLTTHFLYLQILTKVSSHLLLHEMMGYYATAFGVGKPTQILIPQLRSTKKENTCIGFHISLLHILTSLLSDSNNQDIRIHTSASSPSLLKDSSYGFLLCCQAGPWNKPESTQETVKKRLEVRRQPQAEPSTQEVSPWLQGFARLSISQHISERLSGFPNFTITNRRGGTV